MFYLRKALNGTIASNYWHPFWPPSCFSVFGTTSKYFTNDILILQVETKRMIPLPCFYHQRALRGTIESNYWHPFWPPSCFWSSEQFVSLSPLIFLFCKSKRRE